MTSRLDVDAAPSRSTSAPASPRAPFAVLVLAALGAGALTSLLPDSAPWWGIQLAGALYVVLLLPGAVILRILGWPRSPAAALAGCAAWSIVALAPGLVLVLALDGNTSVALAWLLGVIVVGLVIGRGRPVEMDTRICRQIVILLGVTAAFVVLLWLARHANGGDALEHVARLRKMTELDPLRSLDEISVLPPDSGLHPGYAFPLWHAVIALVVALSGLEEGVVFRSLPPLLFPLVVAAIYGAGRRMFGSRPSGVAAVITYLALFAFPGEGVGFFASLSHPGFLSIFLLWPLAVDRAFAYLQEGGREALWTIAAVSFAVAAIHPSYSPFMIILFGAFAGARFLVVRDRSELRRLALLCATITLPFLLFLVWLYPIADSSATAAGPDHFAPLLDRYDNGMLRLKPEFVTRGGAAYVAALLLVPVAASAARTRAAAFIVGGTVVAITLLIVPPLYTPFSDVMSVSQSRRFVFYIPWAFSLVGGALVLARFRYIAVAVALVTGIVLHNLYPGRFAYFLPEPGPAWAAWFAVIGGFVVLLIGAAGKLHLRFTHGWVLPVVAALVLPTAVAGLPKTEMHRDPTGFHDEVVGAVRENVGRDEVLLATMRIAYRLAAHAPVYVTAVPLGHGGDTVVNRHPARREDVATFFSEDVTVAEAADIIRRWDVDWIMIHKNRPYPEELIELFEPVFQSGPFTLVPVDADKLPAG